MTWIQALSKTQINYYIYKLNKNDSILYFQALTSNQYLIILEGIICVLKIFNEKKKFTVGILKTDNAVHLNNNNSRYYYKLIAFEQTYIISFSLNMNKYISPKILSYIIQAQKLTIQNYEIINCILKQQYTKYKIIQFILFLFIEFGMMNNKYIYLSFHLSQSKLSLITGINKNKINNIINQLVNQKIIRFYYNKRIYIHNIYHLFLIYCY